MSAISIYNKEILVLKEVGKTFELINILPTNQYEGVLFTGIGGPTARCPSSCRA